jgi:hypothetical protein
MKPIDPAILVKMIERLLNFPFATICRHSVAADLLDQLGRHGAPVTDDLARAIVGADDETALRLLPALGVVQK